MTFFKKYSITGYDAWVKLTPLLPFDTEWRKREMEMPIEVSWIQMENVHDSTYKKG